MSWKKILLSAVIASWMCGWVTAAIRPIRDDVGFCWAAETMDQLVRLLESTRPVPPASSGWVAGICPHDDYLYAGRIYLPLLRTNQAREVVIIGVTHGGVRRAVGDPSGKIILDTHSQWTGIRGPVAISPLRDWIRKYMNPDRVLVSNQAHILEHSIEAMIPFLQYFRPGIRITPIMVTAMSPDEMDRISRELSRHIATWMRKEKLRPGKDLVFLISADGNHYGKDFSNTPYGENLSAHSRAEDVERELIRDCLEGSMKEARLSRLQHRLDPEKAPPAPLWCGRYSIPFGLSTVLHLVRELEPGTAISGRLLAHSDTWREGVLPLRATSLGTTAPFSLKHWVSFFSMAFFPTSHR